MIQYEYEKESMHKKIGNPYTIGAYDLNMVESAQLTKGWQNKYCMLAVADGMPWATLGVLLGRDVAVMRSCLVIYV